MLGAQTLLLGVVGLDGLAVAWMLVILVGHFLHVGAGSFPTGVVGFVVVHHYSKRQEEILYILSIFLCAFSILAVFLEWRWFATKLTRLGHPVGFAKWLAAITLLPPTALFFAGMSGGKIFLDLMALPRALAVTAALQVAARCLLRPANKMPAAQHDGSLPLSEPPISIFSDFQIYCGFVIVVFCGFAFASCLPFLSRDPGTADALSSFWYVFLTLSILVYAYFVRRLRRESGTSLSTALTRAIYPFLPSVALMLMPLFWYSWMDRVILFVVVISAQILLGLAIMQRSKKIRDFPNWCIPWTCAIFFGAILFMGAMLQNPTFLHGAYIGLFDGENSASWLSDGLLGRAPFRDFIYPYGPLLFYSQMFFVKVFRLDTYAVVYNATLLFAAALCSCYVAATVFRRRLTVFLAAPAMLWIYGALQLRVWLGCVALVAVVSALEKKSERILMLAGIVSAVSVLYSPEVGVGALLTAVLCIVGYSYLFYEKGERSAALHFNARWFTAGLAVIIFPAVIFGAVTGSFFPYIEMNTQLLAIADACCAMPFPSLFSGSTLSVTPGNGPLWLLDNDMFRTFYAQPLLASIAIAAIAVRVLAARKIEPSDAMLAAITIFSIVLFRSALGRADPGHAAFAILPSLIIVFYLCERALLTVARSLWKFASDPRNATWLIPAFVEGVVLCVFVAILLFGIIRVQSVFPAALADPIMSVHKYYTIERALPARVTPGADWQAVASADNQLFFFKDPSGADVPATLAYLESRLGPQDNVCGIPFLSRYQFLVNRPSAIRLGCDTWGLGTAPQWRKRLIEQLDQAKVKFLVYNDAEASDKDGIPWMDREPDLASYYFSHYRVVRTIGETLIFKRGAPAQPPGTIDVSDLKATPFLFTGWYHPEENGLGSFRWTARRATAVVTQFPSDKFFELDAETLPPQSANATAQRLTVALNGRTVLSSKMPTAEIAVHTFSVRVKPVKQPTVMHVSFSTDKPFAAASNFRILGLPVLQFGFTRK